MTARIDRRRLLASAAALTVTAGPVLAQSAPTREQALAIMRHATAFMTGKVALNGGYVWSYLPDFSRRWGEIEAKPSMIWIQPPGTATVGHVFLDAYHATGDEAFYAAAQDVARGLIAAQHPAGGWNYLHDFAGEASLRQWYATVGKNAWRLEEFQHYYGNATFDDAGTAEASQFLLRLYLEKRDAQYAMPLDRAIRFVLDSQYPVGGWPQRFPLADDYTAHITFNDDVAGENIKFLLMVWQTLGQERVLNPIRRAMDSFVVTQQPAPQAGWGLQHTLDLKPAAARTYEPLALVTPTTAGNIDQLITFYRLTGDTKFLARVAEALAWLDSVRLPDEQVRDGRAYPTFIEIGTGKVLTVHRRGSNVVNGAYYADHDPAKPIIHYGQTRTINVAAIRKRYEEALALDPAQVAAGSPLTRDARAPLPALFTTGDITVSDLNSDTGRGGRATAARVAHVISTLNADGWWPSELRAVSNPYIGDGSPTPAPGDFSQTRVGDATDTSPYVTDKPEIGISTGVFVQNMSLLAEYAASVR